MTVEEAADAGMRSIEHLANYRVFSDCGTGVTVETFDLSTCARLPATAMDGFEG